MAAFFTATGRAHILSKFQGVAAPTNYYLVLITAAAAADEDTATFLGLTEIAAGNGYSSGGISVDPNATDFPTLTVDNGSGQTELLMKTFELLATGGPIPASGAGISQIVLTDDDAVLNDRPVYHVWDIPAALSPPLVLQANASPHEILPGRMYLENV